MMNSNESTPLSRSVERRQYLLLHLKGLLPKKKRKRSIATAIMFRFEIEAVDGGRRMRDPCETKEKGNAQQPQVGLRVGIWVWMYPWTQILSIYKFPQYRFTEIPNLRLWFVAMSSSAGCTASVMTSGKQTVWQIFLLTLLSWMVIDLSPCMLLYNSLWQKQKQHTEQLNCMHWVNQLAYSCPIVQRMREVECSCSCSGQEVKWITGGGGRSR